MESGQQLLLLDLICFPGKNTAKRECRYRNGVKKTAMMSVMVMSAEKEILHLEDQQLYII
jgi:hypothetical protein